MSDTAVERAVIARFEKNSKEEVHISLDDFHGRKLIHLRVHYFDGTEWKPGKQGIALGVEHYGQLANAMVQLGEELSSRGLLRL
jgi:hypothetical protein